MTTLTQARAAIQAANDLNTAEAWKAAALAFADLAAKPKGKSADLLDLPNKGKRMINHVIRVTLDDGYTVRMTFGQGRGDTLRDVLTRAGKLCRTIYADNLTWAPTEQRFGGLLPGIWIKAWRDHVAVPAIAECVVVKHGAGPDAGIDLESPPMLAAAE